LDGVILIAPDLDIEVFQSQMARFNSLPAPFAIFVSSRDRALQLSARINGSAVRLGSLEAVEKLGQYPVTIIDVSAFSSLSDGGHFTVGSSPVLIELLGRSQELNRTFETDRAGRAGLLPGTVITVQKATQLILSPHLASTAN
jgi:esterase/lipase superfamily enzyme